MQYRSWTRWLKYTMEHSLYTDLHNKDTDAHNYLHYCSSHPSHCKRGIPFGQFLRLRRICTREEDFIRHALIMGAHFLSRGYPTDLISTGLIRALNSDSPTRPFKHNRGQKSADRLVRPCYINHNISPHLQLT